MMKRLIILLATHGAMLAIGFGLGIYFLPILTAPKAPDTTTLSATAQGAEFTGEFTRELKGSDFLHWGEGTISLTPTAIVHMGRLAPGPDYKLYLTPSFVDDEASFEAIKDQSILVGDIKSFDGAILSLPAGVNIAAYSAVVIWCESFGEFITAAQYQ